MLLDIFLFLSALAVFCALGSVHYARPTADNIWAVAPALGLLSAILFFALGLTSQAIEIPVGGVVWNTTGNTTAIGSGTIVFQETMGTSILYHGVGFVMLVWALLQAFYQPMRAVADEHGFRGFRGGG